MAPNLSPDLEAGLGAPRRPRVCPHASFRLLAESAQQVEQEEDYKHGPESDSGATASPPTVVAIGPATPAQQQNQQND